MFLLFHTYFHIAEKMSGTRSNDALLIRDEEDLRNSDEVCLQIDSDTSFEVVTKRVFVVGHKFILSGLKELDHSFSLKWNFYISRSGKAISAIVLLVNQNTLIRD